MTAPHRSKSPKREPSSRNVKRESSSRNVKRESSSRKLNGGSGDRDRGGSKATRTTSRSLGPSFHAYDFIPKHSPRRSFENYYTLGKLLGEGGFGVAHVCYHKATGAERAVKILPKTDEESKKEAYQEFRMMAKMDHPNIAKTHELYENDQNFYIVQDFYKGGDLFSLVEQGVVPEFEVAMVVSSLLMSIGYFHSKDLCHRDLKPENILLEECHKFHSARIIDFGLARYTQKGDKPFTEVLGSLEYVSPQVLKGSYGKASDVWSAGVITFVLLCARTPFEGEEDEEIMAAIKKGKFEFSDAIWKTISDDCKDFIKKLLAYEEKDRPTAPEALQHPWLQQMRKRHKKQEHDQIQTDIQTAVDALERFRSRRYKLKQATCVLLAAQFLRQTDRDRIDQVFRVLDRRCVGTLNADDLAFAFWFTDITGDTRSDQYIERILREVNFSKTGSISYSEFASVMMLEMGMINEKRLQEVFDYYSHSKDEIDWRDLEVVLFPHSDRHENDCREIIAEATHDHSKVIDFRDFKRIMLPQQQSDGSSNGRNRSRQ